MKVILGLGNPGAKYNSTRHNVGFWVVDALAARHGLEIDRGEKNFLHVQGKICSQDVVLAKPLTYMNESGKAAQALLSKLLAKHSSAENFLVVHDEIDLPLGRIRLKKGGGNAGHRGLESVTEAIGNEYFRCRVGVGRPDGAKEAAQHVLKPFSAAERQQAQKVVLGVCEAVEDFLERDLTQVQNRWHAMDLLS